MENFFSFIMCLLSQSEVSSGNFTFIFKETIPHEKLDDFFNQIIDMVPNTYQRIKVKKDGIHIPKITLNLKSKVEAWLLYYCDGITGDFLSDRFDVGQNNFFNPYR